MTSEKIIYATLVIDYEEYKFIREKLVRNGLLISTYDLEHKELIESVAEMTEYLSKIEGGKKAKLGKKVQRPKFKEKERFKLSKFGRAFIDFFIYY